MHFDPSHDLRIITRSDVATLHVVPATSGSGLADLSFVNRTPEKVSFKSELLWPHLVSDLTSVLKTYPTNYSDSKKLFKDAAAECGATVESFPLQVSGPSGEPLSIDIATLGSDRPKRALLVVGGVHGIEGFSSTVAQSAILRTKPLIDSGDSISFIHCLNPYGMAHLRRTNENNVDINRNFLSSEDSFRGTEPAYAEFDHVLNPKSGTGMAALSRLKIIANFLWHTFPDPIGGFTTLKNGVLTGQYDQQSGIFYGGSRETESTQIFRNWITTRFGQSEALFGIDLHSGLGAWNSQALFVELPTSSERFKKLCEDLALPLSGLSEVRGTYQPRGAMADAIPALLPNCRVDWILHELGTYNPFRVLAALVEENAVHQSAIRDGRHPDFSHWSKRELIEVFNPSSPKWRTAALQNISILFASAGNYLFNKN